MASVADVVSCLSTDQPDAERRPGEADVLHQYHSLLLELITVPLFTGVIGYITNWTGVLMLFRPLEFHGIRVPGLRMVFRYLPKRVQVLPLFREDGRVGWQGIIPSRADKMASLAVDKGLSKLGNVSDFYRQMEPEKLAAHMTVIAQSEIRAIVETLIERENPQLWRNLPSQVKEAVHARVRQQLPEIVEEMTDAFGDNIDQLLDVKLMVIKHFTANPQLLNDLFMIMGKRELRFMVNFGFYFGFPMGFLTVAFLELVAREWYVLPIGGIIIGWVVNYIGISMIFEPIFPKWYCPWRQGLLLKRQPEITVLYAAMVAEKVMTLENIGHELLHGANADRTKALLETTLRPAVDKSMGPARVAVKFAMGSSNYDRLKDSMASEVSAFVPMMYADEEFGIHQAGNIKTFIAKQMSAMGPDDFVELLRSAIKQDEWLLFLHGGVLGAFAGLLHLAIFGV
ncbi:hypothetical protein [Antrihabitans spumae]|uniref:hypothetical protein n=1 Tax=Antrihabitans spumae TaxID=3373370 RepID=UPI003750F594